MLESLATQVDYYSGYIRNNPIWEYAGVYADEARTGTKDERPEFQRLLSDCRAGKIDLVITKSISRFARNTLTMLETVRELKSLDVDVYFERERLHSLSADGELMLTILASFAQEESRSVSENCKWRIKKQFEQGIPNSFQVYGYEVKDQQLTIIPDEAKVVQQIFECYLQGMGKNAIAVHLNLLGIKTREQNLWTESSIDKIIRNEKYVGDMLLQKYYIKDHLTKAKRTNMGELPQYYVENTHSPIICREMYEAVNQERAKRADKFFSNEEYPRKSYDFTGKIFCGVCGSRYRRKLNACGTKYERPVWICTTYNRNGKAACASKQVPEDILIELTRDYEFEKIVVLPDQEIRLCLSDGEEICRKWQYRSRKWTDEMKARNYDNLRRGHNSKGHSGK